ncbi:MAG: hypothetical protein M5U34_16810 [Chloroflexi bacterium]|nr:hypothetical protein [Chloroflexota bacterium]
MKIFKDDAPIYFSMFKVMDLDPGAYRFGIKYFADSGGAISARGKGVRHRPFGG